jgi:hypothetical protein
MTSLADCKGTRAQPLSRSEAIFLVPLRSSSVAAAASAEEVLLGKAAGTPYLFIRFCMYGMAWHGRARHGMAWHGMVWYCGTVCIFGGKHHVSICFL